MKLDTFIVMSKGAAFVLAGFFGPWVAALGQWANSGDWPPRIIWVGVILPLSIIGATSQWVAFCSGSWKEYRQQMQADETQRPVTVVTQPNAPAANTPEK